MVNKITTLIAATLICLITVNGYSQMAKSINALPKVERSGQLMKSRLTDDEKLSMLSLLLPGDSVQFEFPDYNPNEYPDSPRYFPLSISGLHYLDLDSDGDLDLLYSGQSGWNVLSNTKVYYNKDSELQYSGILKGGILDIQKNDDGYIIHTLWVPCCDSYTTIIEKHIFASGVSTSFQHSILVIGLRQLRGLPDFEGMKSATIEGASLFAFPEDFRGISPYFRERSKAVRDSLRKGYQVNLINLKGEIKVKVLDQKTISEDTWYLIMTEPIAKVPKSLYEWTSRQPASQLVGWTKVLHLD